MEDFVLENIFWWSQAASICLCLEIIGDNFLIRKPSQPTEANSLLSLNYAQGQCIWKHSSQSVVQIVERQGKDLHQCDLKTQSLTA